MSNDKCQINELYPIDIFAALYNGKGSFLLESPTGQGKLERYSFIGLNPIKTITSFAELETTDLKHGAFGFLSYDFAWELEKLPNLAKDDLLLPRVYFVIPETLIVFDHVKQDFTIHGKQISLPPSPFSPSPLLRGKGIRDRGLPKSNLNKQKFEQIVKKAKNHIAKGDIYQANLSQRFEAPISDQSFEIYKRLKKINPSPFAAYFDCGDFQICSSSPERLIKLENGLAESRPIAGTRPITAKEEELLLDPKERAEHIMLVDLERNDLGKVCKYGSVHVDETMIIEKYSHVIHIVSNVKGKLRPDKSKFDLIRAMFPGGTITGCPKIRSMEIIEELEPVKRGIYTGSIGYIMPDKMDLNIAIRTIVIKDKKAYLQAGAGIVTDSNPQREYHETLHKAQAMIEAI
ncbi:anthranilate synthase component I [Candidatus Saganbacteria bacterium CG08_land_8_20_14_0_20_45_16]|uniref:Anthranilate synthase component 1 n=1 Tax=Candidatus Saganbacteria bacterium CG08_land_8_20_14_0_20_45_16 TaxID=2014293 RepID=A0A2H0XV14_UNCSA|nr:MAG: anthranilate synthase component I [Candidatus Saganbacteria bacterium CG08_land_8_20_14_0_20_45_16]